MAEYIEREPMIEEMQRLIDNVSRNFPRATETELIILKGKYEAFMEYIKEQQAADVQPVVHAYWIKQPEKFQIPEEVINSNYLYSCSCCNASDLHSERANNDGEVKFCWRCGARMDGSKTKKG